jgi:hypothetical protein
LPMTTLSGETSARTVRMSTGAWASSRSFKRACCEALRLVALASA